MKKPASHTAGKKHPNSEHQLRYVLMMGAAFVVVMLIAFGYRESNSRFQARVYSPLPADKIPKTDTAMPDDAHMGACCAAGECLDLNRSDCSGAGYVYWPNADLCLTACRAIQ